MNRNTEFQVDKVLEDFINRLVVDHNLSQLHKRGSTAAYAMPGMGY